MPLAFLRFKHFIIMRIKNFISTIFFLNVLTVIIHGQNKQDYQWIIGHDTSLLDTGGNGIQFNFKYCPVETSNISTVHNFYMEGANTSMSDEEGNLLFYSNGCYIVNREGFIMENGDSINPGLVNDFWCPSGGSPIRQGVISIPMPGSDSLYYVFNLDLDLPYWLQDPFIGVAPQRLYYQVIDMSLEGGLGKVISKNQIAVQDTFARGNIKAVRHVNGEDWWVIVPKSHSNCYFLMLVTLQGIQPAFLECEGLYYGDDDPGAQTVFTPDATKYIRFEASYGLNIYDFNNATGDLSNNITIDFPNDTFAYGSVSVSPNSRFLYAGARSKLYQFDLQAADIAASKILVGVQDGFADPYPIPFHYSALAPDNKIYISGRISHKHLHVINNPDSLGLACGLEQHGVELPSYNFATIPNFPHYRSQPTVNGCNIYAFEQVICEGDSVLFSGVVLYETGVYTANFMSASGADSISELRLMVLPKAATEINTTICEGQFYVHGSDTLSVPGVYTYSYEVPPLGCDSVVSISLTVVPPYPLTEVYLEIVEGSIHNGIEISMDTTIIDTLAGLLGCDSIIFYHISVIPNSTGEINYGIDFELYPNPTSGAVTINFAETQPGLYLEVYDLMGRLLTTRKVERLKESVDLSDWADDVYVLGIKSKDTITGRVKIIKMKK